MYQVLADRFVLTAIPALSDFDRVFPGIVEASTMQAVAAFEDKLPKTCEANSDCQKKRVTIDCIMEVPWRCSVAVTTTLKTL